LGLKGSRNGVDPFAWRRERLDFIVHHNAILAICKEIERRYRRFKSLSYDRVIKLLMSDTRTWAERMSAEHESQGAEADLKYWRRTFFRWKARKRKCRSAQGPISTPPTPAFGDKGQASDENNCDFITAQNDVDRDRYDKITPTSALTQKENCVTLREKRENVSREPRRGVFRGSGDPKRTKDDLTRLRQKDKS